MESGRYGNTYWTKRTSLWSRRKALGASAAGIAGAASLGLVGCGDDDDDGSGNGANGDNGNDNGEEVGATREPSNGEGSGNGSSGNVTVAQASLDTQDADPHNGVSGIQEPIRLGQGTGLYYQNVEGEVVPGVADEIEYGDDGLSYTIHVKDGITFTNGDPVTGEDVQFSIERMLNASAISALWTSFVESAELVEENVVRVNTSSVAPAFIYTLRSLYTIPKQYTLDMNDGDWAAEAFGDAPIGVGPYRLVENEIGSHIAFEAYDDYFAGAPNVRNVRVNVVPERQTRIAQLQAGEVDVVHGVLSDQLETIESIDGASVAESEGAGTSELTFFDIMDPESPFNDVRVRQALNHAINRQGIIDNLYGGRAILLNSLAVKNPFTVGYDEELASEEPFPYDPDLARELLAEAGWGDGFDTKITTYDTTTTPGTPEMMEAVAADLAQIGVNAPVEFMEAGQYVGLFREKQLTGMGPISFPQSEDFATQYENHYLAGSAFSYDEWEEGDELWAQIQSEIDLDEREQLSQELLRKLSRERVPNIALVGPHALFGLGPRVASYPRPPAQPYTSHIQHITLA